MKVRIVASVLLVFVAVAALWWLAMYRPARIMAAVHADEAAALAAQRAQREAMFGSEALNEEIQWRDTGLGFHIHHEGTGRKPAIGTPVMVNYVGRLRDGTVFDQSKQPVRFVVGQLIPGMNAGLQLLGDGGKATLYIPPRLGYGSRAAGPIPANSGLIFDVEVVTVNP
jgi:FKBP-type peptidyl-prolyl cis-trans isomerase FkpA